MGPSRTRPTSRPDHSFDSWLRRWNKRQSLKSLITRLAGRILRALARRGLRLHAQHLQRHLQPGAKGFAVAHKIIGGGLQSVVDMHGLYLARPALGTGQQQGGGIGPAAERYRQGQRGRRKRLYGFNQGVAHRWLAAMPAPLDLLLLVIAGFFDVHGAVGPDQHVDVDQIAVEPVVDHLAHQGGLAVP